MLDLWNHTVIAFMTWGLTGLAHILGSYALAIIAFTVIIKLALYPLTIQQLKSARAQQVLQPQIQALRVKYANDKQTLNSEMMRLYKENNANPAAGCLPMLIQFPILIGLYNSLYALLRSGIHAGFLWIPNLALPDWFQVPDPTSPGHLIYNGIFLLPVLAGALQWIQQRMMMNPAANQDPQQKMMNQMMQFMPLMVIFFGFRFPAGLALYWVTNTLVAIVQQYFITGWGSLVHIFPFFATVPSPGAGILAGPMRQPTLLARDRLPETDRQEAAESASARRVGSRNGKAGKQDVPRPETISTTSSGATLRGQGQPGGSARRSSPDGNRPRPPVRKQGSKR